MKIRTQFIIAMLLLGGILVVMGASAIVVNREVEKAAQQERIAGHIAQGASELSYLSNDYLIYGESQQLKRWQSRFASFSAQVADLHAERPDLQALIANIRANQNRLKEVFESVASAPRKKAQGQGAALDLAFLQVSWSRMAVQSQALASDASRLSRLFRQRLDQLIKTRTMIMYAMLGLLGIFLLASYLLTYRRILKSIVTLRAGAAVIGSGNLDFVIEERKNDEIGELSRAFNRMARDLKAVTASKADLEKEITERERVEEALRQSESDLNFAQAVAQTGSWRLDLRRTVLLWSDETYRIFGIPKGNPMTYETFLGFVHPDDREYVRRKWIAALGGEPYDIEHRIVVGERVKWVRERGTLEFDASGELLGGFGTAQDITERKQAEEQIRKLNEDLAKRAGELEKANKELDAFASMVAHDLKNQLVIIATLVGRLSKQQQEKLDAKGRQYWDIVNESVRAMASLVDDLLEMSRVSRIQMKPEKVDLRKLAWSIVKKYQEKDADRQIELVIPEKMEVEGDRRLLEVALDNLLGNAWKFTKHSNPARIQLGVSVEAEGPVFYIRDNGCGFNCSANAEKVFLPFQRFHTSDEYPGTGLGLATVKRILDRHGGKIWIESEVGKGTTIYFSFGDGSRS